MPSLYDDLNTCNRMTSLNYLLKSQPLIGRAKGPGYCHAPVLILALEQPNHKGAGKNNMIKENAMTMYI